MTRTHAHTVRRGGLVLAALAVAGILLVAAGPVRANTVKKTDLVFLIDATGSMAGEIAAVKSGLSSFVGGLGSSSIDARYALVLYGGAPELVLDFTSDGSALQTAFGQISVNGSVGGFQNNHNVNPEAGLEAIRIVLNGATDNTLLRTHVGGSGPLSFRSDARKNLILVTDEDSDRPYYSANRYSDQTSTDPPGTLTGGWAAEVDDTADVAVANAAYLNMLVNRGDSPTIYQYGDPNQDVSDSDFSNWDATATLDNLVAAGLGSSLQAQMLDAGLVARTFSITDVSNTGFIDNFFAAKLEEIQDDPGPVIPEPSIVCAFGMGLVSLVGYVRRRRAGNR